MSDFTSTPLIFKYHIFSSYKIVCKYFLPKKKKLVYHFFEGLKPQTIESNACVFTIKLNSYEFTHNIDRRSIHKGWMYSIHDMEVWIQGYIYSLLTSARTRTVINTNKVLFGYIHEEAMISKDL